MGSQWRHFTHITQATQELVAETERRDATLNLSLFNEPFPDSQLYEEMRISPFW